ncbi:unnamed protein product [Citrullus colocynthis]|uniref:Uncharacterized protein n=1 Tax=Citrullus colocynthis TaxID=252529 RepID=A0ABP0ZA04_9ROSI
MFVFMLDEIHEFVDAISILAGLDYVFDLKFSPKMLSIMVNRTPSSRCTIALQLFPPFFNQGYSCQELHYSWIYINQFFPEMFHLERTGFSSLTFSFADPHHADLTFRSADGRLRAVDFPMYHSDESMDVGEFDLGTFVSFSSREFVNIVTLNNFDSVMVTLRNSQVKFSYAGTDMILTQEKDVLLATLIHLKKGRIDPYTSCT